MLYIIHKKFFVISRSFKRIYFLLFEEKISLSSSNIVLGIKVGSIYTTNKNFKLLDVLVGLNSSFTGIPWTIEVIVTVRNQINIWNNWSNRFAAVITSGFYIIHRTKRSENIWYVCAFLLIDTCHSKSHCRSERMKRFSLTVICALYTSKMLKGS